MTTTRPSSILPRVIGCLLVFAVAMTTRGDDNTFLLITGELEVEAVEVIEINTRRLLVRDDAGAMTPRDIDACVALVRSAPPRLVPDPSTASANLLQLADGQRLPGLVAIGIKAKGDAVVWIHPWLGRVEVPLDSVQVVTLQPGARVTKRGQGDVVSLANGDHLEGLVIKIGPRHVVIELDDRPVRIPLGRVRSVQLVTPKHVPSGQRVWFHDHTRIDVSDLTVGDDGYVRFRTAWSTTAEDEVEVRITEIAAILFNHDRLVALGGLTPARLEAVVPRYVLPAPQRSDADAALGLGPIDFRGPIIVRYALPAGCRRFAARATLPEADRAWGDFDLVIRDDDREVFRKRLNADDPSASLQVPITGSELTIELQPGARGSVQDHLVLEHAMLLLEP